MKILITGTAGFIGFHLANRLLQRGDSVIGIDNINNYYDPELKYARLADAGIGRVAEAWHTPVQSTKHPRYRFVRMNMEDRDQLNSLFEKEQFDKVCNLAAQAGVRYSLENPHAYISSNIVGFLNILEACRHRNIQHLVYASSSSVYGNSQKMPLTTADNVDHPISLYAATKKSNELMAHTYSHLFGLPATGLRFFTVYGPWGRPDNAYFLFTKAILANQPINVFNNGNLARDFTYIDDIVEGVLRVIDSLPSTVIPVETSHDLSHPPAPYKIYNIGNSTPVALGDFIRTIEKTLGKKAIKKYLPMQPGDVQETFADVTGLEKDMGYQPNTSVQQGITAFVEWYKRYYTSQ